MGWRNFEITPSRDYEDKEDYVNPKSEHNPHNPLNPPRVSRKPINEREPDDISVWLNRVMKACTTDDVLGIVECFRPLDWTDGERAQMSRCYVPKLYYFEKMAEE